MNSLLHLVCRLLTVIIALYNGIRAVPRDAFDDIYWGYKLDVHDLGTFFGVLFGQCHQKCLDRPLCESFSYHRLRRECLLSQTGDLTDREKSPGWIWKKVNITNRVPGCSECRGECIISNGTVLCDNNWCGAPTQSEQIEIKGNVYSEGSKVKHVCQYNLTNHVISTCSNGTWSTEQLHCDVGCTELPTVHGGNFTTPDGVAKGAIGTVHCPSGTSILTENTASCLSTGNWSVTSFVCWSRVDNRFDGQTKKIFNPSLNKTWRYDGMLTRHVSVRRQTNDSFEYFNFTYNATDGSYTLYGFSGQHYDKVVCHGAVSNARFSTLDWPINPLRCFLYGKSDCPNDRRRCFLYYDSSTDLYLIKYNGRFVGIGRDTEYVSSCYNLPDDRAEIQIL